MGEYEERLASERRFAVSVVVWAIFGLILLSSLGLWGCPQYSVWQQGMSGKAKLAEAEYGRQTLVAKAKAEKEAAALLAEAEVLRADGASKSAKIIGQGLEKNPNYLQYLAIQAQRQNADSPNHTTIYIPVGPSGIPIVKTLD